MPRRKASLVSFVLAMALCVMCAITPSSAYAYDGQLQEYDDVSNIAAHAARVVDASSGLVPTDAVGVDQVSDAPDYSNATKGLDDSVNLASDARTTHILQGDATGGGHLWPGGPGKTPFPQEWSGSRIMHEISDIATDPVAWTNAKRQGSRTVLTGTRGGVDIRVVVDSTTGEIVTGFPTNLLRNP